MVILGINAYHADASACVIVDGILIAAVEEERFRRIKHWAGFPTLSIKFCLQEAGVPIQEVDHIAISRDPKAHFIKKIWFALSHRFNPSHVKDRLRNRSQVKELRVVLAEELGVSDKGVKAKIHHVEHHRAHMGSAFFVSPFEESAAISIDALGDYVSTMWARGGGRQLQVLDQVLFPHSLGFLYTAGTQFLGFPKYGDEYKVMGLAAYGQPSYLDAMRKIIHSTENDPIKLDLSYFRHHNEGVAMTWDGGEPVIGPMYSPKWVKLLGPVRKEEEALTQKHRDIAASLQAIFEEAYFNVLNKGYRMTQVNKLALAGGCAMNSVANGKILDRTPFQEVYIQPAAGDAGTSIGSAYYVYHQILGHPRSFEMTHSYWGPEFADDEFNEELRMTSEKLNGNGFKVTRIENEDLLCRYTAQAIADGKVVGWFQGRMEWGARALGNRSILADPRRTDMRDILNERIKRRESFRPFAPSILEHRVGDYFEKTYPDPFMLKVYSIRLEKRSVIPAVTHIDGTGRLQTINPKENPLYWKLIKAFESLTGVPVLLNTSFNENEPIVCSPRDALGCFERTNMDILVLGNYFLEKEKFECERQQMGEGILSV